MDRIITLLIIITCVSTVIYVMFTHIQLPEVGVADDTGKCVWIKEIAGNTIEKKHCPMVLPDKYLTTIVRGNP